MELVDALCPLDGRYNKTVKPLTKIFCEKSVMSYQIKVEAEYLIALSELKLDLRTLSEEEKIKIRGLSALSSSDKKIIKEIETTGYKNIPATNHDLKAIEYFMKDKLRGTSLDDCIEWIHFGLTSEDVKNIAYGLIITDSIEQIIFPKLMSLMEALKEFSHSYKDMPMLARTHGQPASPTTVGKEFNVFYSRLRKQEEKLLNYKFDVKLNGATGNYNALYVAYPQVDWIDFSQKFIQSLNSNKKILLNTNLITTQIDPHDTYVGISDMFRHINNILINLNQDMWRYVSDDWFVQKPKKGEIGSSTMPHKINPIDFETSEGCLGIANALFIHFSNKLPISRLQRDLSDSTVLRNFGFALGNSFIGYHYALQGLHKIQPNETKLADVLDCHPEIISEAIQTLLRREGNSAPYEKLMELTRGKRITLKEIHDFIDSLDIKDLIKSELKQITPRNYIGLASKLAVK